MKCVLFFILMICSVLCYAGICKRVLSDTPTDNRRTYEIQKDADGYMWFATYSGINRYDGSCLKQYELLVHGKPLNMCVEKCKLYVANNKQLWLTTASGYVFLFSHLYDRYELVRDFRTFQSGDLYSLCIDNQNNIWFANQTSLFVYSTSENTIHPLNNRFTPISAMTAAAPGKLFLACKQGVFIVSTDNYASLQVSEEISNKQCVKVNELLYHAGSSKLFISDSNSGLCTYDLKSKQFIHSLQPLSAGIVSCLKELNEHEILIATDGTGIHRMDVWNYHTEPYRYAGSKSDHTVCSNRISDVFIDEQKRIWVADYPAGVTVISQSATAGEWYTHTAGDEQSLRNSQVNAVLKDSEGDLWFATDEGICYYQPKTGRWNRLPLLTPPPDVSSCLYTSLCEARPGEIWAVNYAHGIYVIEKHSGKIEYPKRQQPGVRFIHKDSLGRVWAGRRDQLICTDIRNNHEQVYQSLPSVNAIAEKDSEQMWIGSESGLFVLHLKSGRLETVPLPVEHAYIHVLYQKPGGKLYVGTEKHGMFVYDSQRKTTRVYNGADIGFRDCHIHSILPDNEGNLLVSTNHHLMFFNIEKSRLYHVRNDPLPECKTQFVTASGTYAGDGKFIFGTSNGVVKFDKYQYPFRYSTCLGLFFDELKVFGQLISPGEEGSPLKYALNSTYTLYLDYDQNVFSFKVSSVNYDSPSSIVYSWRLNDEKWSIPSGDATVNYSNLHPGEYIFSVRAISGENGRPVFQRNMRIVIRPSIWSNNAAFSLYGIIGLALGLIGIRGLFIWKERNLFREKISLLMNASLNICTPLALIKSPLEAMCMKVDRSFSKDFQIILQQLKGIDYFFSRLATVERMDTGNEQLRLIEIELNAYLKSITAHFQPYAKKKNVQLIRRGDCELASVWVDVEKLKLIVTDLLTGIIDRTPMYGQVEIVTLCSSHHWEIEINSINSHRLSRRSDSQALGYSLFTEGMSWHFARRLVKLHKGKLLYSHKKEGEISVRMILPIAVKQTLSLIGWFARVKFVFRQLSFTDESFEENVIGEPFFASPSLPKEVDRRRRYSVLLIEERDELRTYLQRVLSENYSVTVLSSGENALDIVHQKLPDLVLSAAILSGISGYEFCIRLKADEVISHIPVVLFAEPGNDNDFLQKLYNAADLYLTIPFSISVLKADIDSLIINREVTRKRYVKLALESDGLQKEVGLPEDDAKFIARVRQTIETCLSTPGFNVDVLCAQMNMSRSTFYSRMKLAVNQAPAGYIRTVRMGNALRLLLMKKYTVIEVAELTGFNDAKYFREVFRKYYGASPFKYINSL